MSNDREPFPSPEELEQKATDKLLQFAAEFEWNGKKLVALDRSVIDKLERKKFSASSAKGFSGCSVRWAFEKRADVKGPMNDAVLGGAMHSMFEYLFALAPLLRSVQLAKKFITELAVERFPIAADLDAESAALIEARRLEWDNAINLRAAGYFARQDLSVVRVVANEMELELEVRGILTIAYIDRVDDAGFGLVELLDYKSGKVPDLRWGDDHGDQLRLYKVMYELKHGAGTVASAAVEYTRSGERVMVDLSPEAIEKTLDKYEKAFRRHKRAIKAGELATVVDTLCGWCGVVNSCPAAQAAGKTDRRGGLPTREMLPMRVIQTGAKFVPAPAQSQAAPGDYLSMTETTANTPEPLPAELPENTVKGSEGRPWEFSIDGVRNPGSYEYLALFSATNTAMKMINDSTAQQLNKVSLVGLSATIHRMACEVQRIWLGGVDVMAPSHTRARGAITSVLDTMPAPFGGTSAEWDNWVSGVTKRAVAMTETVSTLVAGTAPSYPWLSLASDGPQVRETRLAADVNAEAEANRMAVAETLFENAPAYVAEFTPEPAPALDAAAPVETVPSSLAGMDFDF